MKLGHLLYLYQKQQRLAASGVNTSPLPPPEPPLHGWEQLKQNNPQEMSTKVPNVSPGK